MSKARSANGSLQAVCLHPIHSRPPQVAPLQIDHGHPRPGREPPPVVFVAADIEDRRGIVDFEFPAQSGRAAACESDAPIGACKVAKPGGIRGTQRPTDLGVSSQDSVARGCGPAPATSQCN